jgi:CheY-like chemotaxis protein
VILDIGLPGMNGYDVARQIRADHPDAGIVIVALTGYGSDHDQRQAVGAGFDFHLVKPIDLTRLQALVAKTLRRHSGKAGDSTDR